MKRPLLLATALLALAGCTHKRLTPVTINVPAPKPVYLEPAPGRVVSAVLVDIPDPQAAQAAPPPAPTAPMVQPLPYASGPIYGPVVVHKPAARSVRRCGRNPRTGRPFTKCRTFHRHKVTTYRRRTVTRR